MKKSVLLVALLWIYAFNARADVCFDVSKDIADKAVEIIKTQKVLYDYCSICPDAQAKEIKVKDIENSNPIKVNRKSLDLAHIYFKENNKYINLGIKVGCIKNEQYNISAELNELPKIHHTIEGDKTLAKSLVKKIYENCFASVEKLPDQTTNDMIEKNVKINDCLNTAINQEIQKGFNTEQQVKMRQYVEQLRKNTIRFYYGIYAENKYCEGSCGTITNIIPYSDEGKMLSEILEHLLYLNIAKNGY